MKRSVVVTVSVLAGATLLEAALIPGILIGGGIVLAPKVLSKYLPRRRRHMGRRKQVFVNPLRPPPVPWSC
jgi:hypothetical protein